MCEDSSWTRASYGLVQDMLGRALAEIQCLRNRGQADRALLKAHQSRAFFAEEEAAQQDACRGLQPVGVADQQVPHYTLMPVVLTNGTEELRA